jgi:DivIVA domain-containing protein
MELERGHIQKRDFPHARKGYDPDAVDSHLRAVADAVDQLRAVQATQSSLAGTAASRVEAIVAAAEVSAREIEARANEEAAGHVARAQESVEGLVEQAGALRSRIDELDAALASLLAAIVAMTADAAPIAAEPESASARRASSTPAEPVSAAPVGPIHPEPAPEAPAPVILPEEEPEPEAEPEPEEEVEPEALTPRPKPAGDGDRASEGARLIALNMALSGTPREETARYLRENFALDDQDALLDEVYAKVGS